MRNFNFPYNELFDGNDKAFQNFIQMCVAVIHNITPSKSKCLWDLAQEWFDDAGLSKFHVDLYIVFLNLYTSNTFGCMFVHMNLPKFAISKSLTYSGLV